MEKAPTLRLEITPGPRAGEALEFKPGKKVGIGRLVRGNAIQIKDNGISSKHLSIEFDSSSGKWLISDLESSNGTILNDVDLDPLVPEALSDGDVVKIGEYTSINVKVGVRVENESLLLVGESNVRRNPRRRAVVKAVVDLEEKKVLQVQGGDVGVGESVAEKRGPRGAPKRKDVKKVEDNGAELEVVEDSDAEVEKKYKMVETGRRRGRPKKVNGAKGVGEGVETVVDGENCNEGLKGEVQKEKKTRGVGRGGARRGRGVKGRNGEDESAVADHEVAQVVTHVVEVSRGGRGGSKNLRDLHNKSTVDESDMVGGESDQPLQSFPLEDGNKKKIHGRTTRAQVAYNEIVKETPQEKEIKNSEGDTHGDLVHIKTEKFSICPSVQPENQVSQLDSNGPSEILEVENAIGSGISEPLGAVGIRFEMQENEDASRSYKVKEIENSSNDVHPSTQNIKQEKNSNLPSIQDKIPEHLCMEGSEVEFVDKRSSEPDELGEIDYNFSAKVDGTAGLATHDSLEGPGVPRTVAVDTEMMDFGSKACQEMPAEFGCHSEGRNEMKLEEMTLGQWFDYLEVYLPKQIYDSTEEMISSMIEKSKRFQKYESHQQKKKRKVLPCQRT